MIDIHFGRTAGIIMLIAAAFLAETVVCLLTVPIKNRRLGMGISGLVPAVLFLFTVYSFAANVLNGIADLPYPRIFGSEDLSASLHKTLDSPDMQAFLAFSFSFSCFFGTLTAFLLFLVTAGQRAHRGSGT